MLNSMKIIAFAATQDAETAKQFYQQTLGLSLIADEPFALVFNANGTMLRLQKVKEFQPQPYTVLGWEVKNMETAIKNLTNQGVHFEHFPGIPQNELGITVFDGGAKVAWFKDTDGNILSLTQA